MRKIRYSVFRVFMSRRAVLPAVPCGAIICSAATLAEATRRAEASYLEGVDLVRRGEMSGQVLVYVRDWGSRAGNVKAFYNPQTRKLIRREVARET